MDVRETLAQALEPEIWAADGPVNTTRDAVETFHYIRQSSIHRADAILAALKEAGYVVVPNEASEKMLNAFDEATLAYMKAKYASDDAEGVGEGDCAVSIGFRAMLAAAQEQGGE